VDQPIQGELITASAPAPYWKALLWRLWTHASERLAGASLLLDGALAAGAWALWTFGNLADDVREGDYRAVDDGVHAFLRTLSSPSLDEAARVVSAMGSEVVGLLLVALVLVFGWQRRWGTVGALLLVTLGAQLLNNVLKEAFQRARPAGPMVSWIAAQQWSFPSGHAMVSAAFYAFLGYVGWQLLRGWPRLVWAGLLSTLVLLIGLTRIYLGVHYLTDVLAGYLVGLVWTEAVILAGHLLSRRHPTGT
jgi:undecaprenyl-diphosphatase